MRGLAELRGLMLGLRYGQAPGAMHEFAGKRLQVPHALS